MKINEHVKESEFWQQVKRHLDRPGTHICRIENEAGNGISDVNACRGGIEVWVELKVFHGNRLYFRNSQRVWISRRVDAGGRVFILARDDDWLYLYGGADAMRSKFTSIGDGKAFWVDADDLPTSLYYCTRPFNWPEVAEKLFGQP